MKMTLIAIVTLLSSLTAACQKTPLLDSLKAEYAEAKDGKKRLNLLVALAHATMTSNPKEADKYGDELIVLAEKTDDPVVLAKANISNGDRCAQLAVQKEYASRAMNFFENAKEVARKNNLKKYQVIALLKQADLQLALQNSALAANYLEQASTLGAGKIDSTTAIIASTRGDIQLAGNKKTDALRSYLFALRLADSLHIPPLQRQGLVKMADFYRSIEDYDKAIEYYKQATLKLDELPPIYKAAYVRGRDKKAIGDLYLAKEEYSLARSYYEAAISVADSLQDLPQKVQGYSGLLTVFLAMKDPAKSLAFMNSENGGRMKAYLQSLNLDAFTDQTYAIIYSEMGELDSAGKYFDRSFAFFENSGDPDYRTRNLLHLAFYWKRKGDHQQAIRLFLEAGEIVKSTGQLEYAVEINKNLDTLYDHLGDYRQSKFYSAAYFQVKDSLRTLNKEKELTKIEADDLLQQVQREQQLMEEQQRERNNIQYIAITTGIVVVFFLLILLGMFRVSARTIRIVGFFAFLLFFEFIFLVSKTSFHHFSHGEPWIDLLFLVGLAAVLEPLHHLVEHKVLHFLTAQNKLTSTGDRLKRKLSGK